MNAVSAPAPALSRSEGSGGVAEEKCMVERVGDVPEEYPSTR